MPIYTNSLIDLNLLIANCTNCSLHKDRKNTVPGNGKIDADLMFISEGPGFHEDRTGKPFMGLAGGLLDDLLNSIEMTRDDVFVANIIKCRTDNNNRDPYNIEILSCKFYLDEQIRIINPKLIVCLGRYATNKFFPNSKITQIRGKPVKINNKIILPIMHPAAGLRSPIALQKIKDDFLLIPSLLQMPELIIFDN